MSKFTFVVCDDVRRELSGKVSFMGVFGPVMEVDGDSDFSFSVVSLIRTAFGSDLSGAGVSLQVCIDGVDGEMHPFPKIEASATTEGAKPDRVAQIEKVLATPGIETMLYGTIRIAGLNFSGFCKVRAFAEGVLVHEVVIVRSSFIDSAGAIPKKRSTRSRAKKG